MKEFKNPFLKNLFLIIFKKKTSGFPWGFYILPSFGYLVPSSFLSSPTPT